MGRKAYIQSVLVDLEDVATETGKLIVDLQKANHDLVAALDGVMTDVSKTLTHERYLQVQKALANAKDIAGGHDE